MQPGGKLEISSSLVHLKSDLQSSPCSSTFPQPINQQLNDVFARVYVHDGSCMSLRDELRQLAWWESPTKLPIPPRNILHRQNHTCTLLWVRRCAPDSTSSVCSTSPFWRRHYCFLPSNIYLFVLSRYIGPGQPAPGFPPCPRKASAGPTRPQTLPALQTQWILSPQPLPQL